MGGSKMIKLKNILLEKKEFQQVYLDKLNSLTQRNNHTDARVFLSVMMGNKKLEKFYKAMYELNDVFGGYGPELSKLNQKMEKELYRQLYRKYSNYDEIYDAL